MPRNCLAKTRKSMELRKVFAAYGAAGRSVANPESETRIPTESVGGGVWGNVGDAKTPLNFALPCSVGPSKSVQSHVVAGAARRVQLCMLLQRSGTLDARRSRRSTSSTLRLAVW